MRRVVVKLKSSIEYCKFWIWQHPSIVRVMMIVTGLLISDMAFATDEGVIPTPDDADNTSKGSLDFLDALKNIILNEAGPILVYGGALFFVVLAVFDIYRGYKKYQDTDDFGKFKMSLVTGAILVVVGLGLFFMGQYIMAQWNAVKT